MYMKTGQIECLTLLDRSSIVSGVMNLLAPEKRLAVLAALVEGNSIRSIERLTGVHRDTIMRLMVRAGLGCADLLDTKLRNLPCKRVQVDEIWTFVFVKERRMNCVHNHAEMGDQYVFVAIDADTKLVVSHLVGKRDVPNTYRFVADLKERLANRVQLTTDGFT